MKAAAAYSEDVAFFSCGWSNDFVRERMSRNGSPAKLDFRAGSIVPKVGRRCCSSCRCTVEEETAGVLARRKGYGSLRLPELLGSTPVHESFDTGIRELMGRQEVQNASDKTNIRLAGGLL